MDARLQLLSTAYQAARPDFATIAVVVGDSYANLPDNLRSTAIIQFLLASSHLPTNAGIILTFTPAVTLTYCIGGASNLAGVAVDGGEASAVAKQLSLEEFTAALASLMGQGTDTVRTCAKELQLQQGAFVSALAPLLRPVDDATQVLGALLFVKDAHGLANIGKAGMLATAVCKRYILPTLEAVVSRDDGKTTLHAFSSDLSDRIAKPVTIPGLEKLEAPEEFSPGLPVYVTHAGEYTEKITEGTGSEAPLQATALIVRYGVKYRGYTAYMARTILFEKAMPRQAAQAYEFALDVQATLLEALVPNAHVAAIASKVLETAKAKNPEFAAKLVPVLGWVTGLNVQEVKGQIGAKGTTTVQADMAFVVRVVVQDLEDAGKTYAIELADTVVVGATGPAAFRTKAPRLAADVIYATASDDAFGDDAVDVVETRKDLRSITRAGQAPQDTINAEGTRMKMLAELLASKEAEWKQNGGKRVTQEVLEEQRTYDLGRLGMGELACYPSSAASEQQVAGLPPSLLHVHRETNAMWLPVNGKAVPFHVSTVNKIDLKKEGSTITMVVTFHSTQESNHAFKQHRTKVFIRELAYTAPAARFERPFEDFGKAVRELQAKIKNADAARKAKQGLAAAIQVKPIGNPMRLRAVKMRPPPAAGGKDKDKGNLELHDTGLRFTFNAGEPLEFHFDNIKHCIFQHALKGDSMTIFHITLKQPMMIGKRKTDEVQVVAEILRDADDLDKGGRRGGEAAEAQEEEQEHKLLIATNTEFMNFSRAVSAKSGRAVETSIQKFGFQGVPLRENTHLRGSTNVLWAIKDFPFFTMNVKEIEIAHFERAAQGSKTVDVSFIPFTYKSPITITAIMWGEFGVVKDWCLAAKIPYAEHAININWAQMLKVIREDQEWEPWSVEGGWRTCIEDDDEEEEDDDDDSSYHESEDEDGSDGGSDDDDEGSDEDESDLDWDESESGPDTESSGSDDDEAYWEKMDKKANDEDRKRQISSDDDSDDSDAKRRKKKGRVEAPRGGPAAGRSGGKAPPAAAPGGFKRPGGGPAAAPAGGFKSSAPAGGKLPPLRPAGYAPPRPAPGLPPRR